MSAELNGVLRNLHRIQQEQELGRVQEVVIRTEGQNLLLFSPDGRSLCPARNRVFRNHRQGPLRGQTAGPTS